MRYFEIVRDEHRKNPNVEIQLPTRASEHSGGYDFYSPINAVIQPHESIMIWTDIKAHMYYDNAVIILPRSSMGKHPVMIANTVGLIDMDYYSNPNNDGNIGFRLFNLNDNIPYEIKIGDRIGQGVFIKYGTVKDDTTTAKREGGFGSSGI
jgi:dUTP pyrophosphatase